jgi:hypothetical protein
MSEGGHGKTEVESLRRMVVAWTDGYRGLVESAEDGTFFAKELMSEVEEVVYPYLTRLETTGYIQVTEISEFMVFCEGLAGELGAPAETRG